MVWLQGIQVGKCGFIRWFNPPMCSRSKNIIPKLLRIINQTKEDITMLKSKLRTRSCVNAKKENVIQNL